MKKKTITKVLLVLVMLALVFSLWACQNGNNNNGQNSGGGKTTTDVLGTPAFTTAEPSADGKIIWSKVQGAEKYEYVVTDAEGNETTGEIQEIGKKTDRSYTLNEGESFKVRAVPAAGSGYKTSEWSESVSLKATAVMQVISLLSGVEGLVNTLNDVQVTSTLGAELAVAGFFETKGKRNSVSLGAQANVSKNDPEFMFNFMLNEKKYVSLGYSNGKVYVREPMNKINTTDENANAFYIDLSALKDSVPYLMEPVMEMLAKQDIKFEQLSTMVTGFLKNGAIGKAINGILDKGLKKNEDGSTTLGITVGLLSSLIPALSLLGETEAKIATEVDKYIGYANKVLEVIGKEPLSLNGEAISYDYITKELLGEGKISPAIEDESLLEIVFSDKTVGGKKVLDEISLVLNLGAFGFENIDFSLGLNIKLPVFSLSDEANIKTSDFGAKDLVIDLTGALPLKELDATATGVVRLSTALANKTNTWADLTITSTGDKKSYAYINNTGAYADFGGLFDSLALDESLGLDKTAYTTKYKALYKNSDGTALDPIALINEFAASIGEEDEDEGDEGDEGEPSINEPEQGSEGEGEAEINDEEDFDLMGFVMDIVKAFQDAEDKTEFVCATIVDLIPVFIDEDAVFEEEGTRQAALIKYIFNIKFGDTNTSAQNYCLFYKNATTFKALLDNIKAAHEEGKAALEAATHSENKTAGVQLFKDGDNNDLLDYVAKFVVVPTIRNGEPSFEEADLKAPNDKDALKGWLNWIFPVDNEYRVMVEDILGITLESVIDGGVYLEAKGLTGLAGEVKVAAGPAAEDDVYVSLGGAIAIKSGAAAVSPFTAEASFTDKGEGEDADYLIKTMAKALLQGLRDYGKAA